MSGSVQPGFDGLTIPLGEWPRGYTYRVTRYADVILRDSFPGHWDDLISTLDAFRIDPATDIYQAGGNRSSVAVRFDGALRDRGWGKRNITISMSISTIGQRIQAARKRAVWGQAELARAAGISVNTLWQIENGRRQPRPATIRKIAAALQIAPSDLLERPDQA